MMTSIDKLKEIAHRCMESEPLSEEQIGWLGRALDEFLCHRTRSLKEAFGICQGRGGVPWWVERAIRERDAALRQLSALFYTDASVSTRASLIATKARRYAATAWRFDQDREEMPTRYADTPAQWIWIAFKSGARMPISERHLRSLLAN